MHGPPVTTAPGSRPASSKGTVPNFILALTTAIVIVTLSPTPTHAQGEGKCRVLCAPELSVEPTVTFSSLFRRTAVLELQENRVVELAPSAEFEIIFAVGVPTTIPRVGFTLEVVWAPFATTSGNPFTGETAEELGRAIRENPVELEFEFNIQLLENERTGGWLGAHFDVVDQFSPAARPHDAAYYTHKLDLELDVAVGVFNWLPAGHWLRNVELEGSLDYLATGLPRNGDEVPKGELRFLDDASPWSFSVLVVIPLAPLTR